MISATIAATTIRMTLRRRFGRAGGGANSERAGAGSGEVVIARPYPR